MDYATLTTGERAEALRQRLRAYEQSHFTKTIDRDLLVHSGAKDGDTLQAIATLDASLATLDTAHAEVARRLAALESEGA